NGLGNDGGHVGRWLTDTPGIGIDAFIPDLVTTGHSVGAQSGHVYLPWIPDTPASPIPRGYHIEVRSDAGPPIASSIREIERFAGGGGLGVTLKNAYREHYGRVVTLAGRGEMIPNSQSYCALDPSVVDRWGIPVLRFHWAWGEHERVQAVHMRARMHAIIDAMGGVMLTGGPWVDAHGMPRPGSMSHEVGCVRMGISPDRSALDASCTVHGVRNLVVADGGPFVSHPNKNPTWTIMALAWRTTGSLIARSRRRDL
ncbi:MAG TPA: GMC family oxidoreductase, partial [Gemmatimonadaceae bacterium]